MLKESKVVSWNWLALTHSDGTYDVADSFQLSTLMYPFIEALNCHVDTPKLSVEFYSTIKPNYLKLLEMYYRAEDGDIPSFNPKTYIEEILTRKELTLVLVIAYDNNTYNVRSYSKNKIERSPYFNETELVALEYTDYLTDDLRGLDIIFNTDSLFTTYQLIEQSRSYSDSICI